MAFPSVLGRNTVQASANATATNDPIPSFSRGDLLLAFLGIDGTTAPTWGTGFPGWNTFGGLVTIGNSACQLAMLYRVADGSEGNFAVDLGASENWCSEIVVIDAGTFDENTPPAFGTAVSSSAADPNPPALNPADWGTEDTLWIAASAGDNDVAYTAAPSGYSNSSLLKSTDGTAANRVALGYAELQSAAASEDPGVFTRSAEDSSAQTYGIRPFTAAHAQPILWAKSFYSTGTATVDVTITILAGTNRRLVVHTGIELSGASFTSVTLDPAGVNEALTLCTDGTTSASQNQDSVAFNRFWSLIDSDLPAPGTYTLRVVVSTATEVAITALLVEHTDQTQNVASVAVNGTTSGTTTTAAPTVGTNNSLVISGCYKNNAATPLSSMVAASLNMMPRGSVVLPTNGAHFVVAAKGLSTESGSINVVETVPGAVRLSLVAIVLKPAFASTVAGTMPELTGAANADTGGTTTSTVAGTMPEFTGAATATVSTTSTCAGVMPGLTGALSALLTIPCTVGPPPPILAGGGGSTMKGTVGVTTSWAEHELATLQGIRSDAVLVNLGENGYSSWHLLPTGTTGQPGYAPAVDTNRNITALLAVPGVQAIVINLNEFIAARDDFGFAGTLEDYIPIFVANLQVMEDAAEAAGVPIFFTTPQPNDSTTDAEFEATLPLARTAVLAAFGEDRVIDFYGYLVDVDGTIINALTTDQTHPDDDATPTMASMVHAKVARSLGMSMPLMVGAATSNTTGAAPVSSTCAGVMPGLTGALSASESIPSTCAGVMPGLTCAASALVAPPITSTVAGVWPGFTGAIVCNNDDGIPDDEGGHGSGGRGRGRSRYRGYSPP